MNRDFSSFGLENQIAIVTGASQGIGRAFADALGDAAFIQEPVEVLVAQGLYTPDQGKNQTLDYFPKEVIRPIQGWVPTG